MAFLCVFAVVGFAPFLVVPLRATKSIDSTGLNKLRLRSAFSSGGGMSTQWRRVLKERDAACCACFCV